MLHRAISGFIVAVLALSLPVAIASPAEAGPPAPATVVFQASLDDACVASITWDPLRGGKPIYARVIFKYLDTNGDFQTANVAGAEDFYRVKQNAGSLEIDFGAAAASQPASDYRIDVSFVDGKDVAMSGPLSTYSPCSAVS
jgi:hypothetical protein